MIGFCLLLVTYLVTMSCVDSACSEERNINVNSANGTVAINLRRLESCLTSGCSTFEIRKLVITFANHTTANPLNPIKTCGLDTDGSIANIFCWNKTDQTVQVSRWFSRYDDVIVGGSFLYTIRLDAKRDCYVLVNVKHVTSTTTSKPVATSNSTMTPKTTSLASKPAAQVQVISMVKKEIKVSLYNGSNSIRLECNYTCRNIKKTQIRFVWEKDSWPLEEHGKSFNYRLSNYTYAMEDNAFNATQILSVSKAKPVAQGYFQCVLEAHGRFAGNQTLIWFSDVSTMRWEIQVTKSSRFKLQNRTVMNIDEFENIFQTKLTKSLKKNRLRRENFDLYVKQKQNQSALHDPTVKIIAYYRNVTEKEKLRICDIIFHQKFTKDFNVSSFDCCMPSKSTGQSSSGEIDWPITLHGHEAKKRCPFNALGKQDMASRSCRTDFLQGPSWQPPKTEKCPVPSRVTRDLQKLSELKVNKKNKEETVAKLRNLTKTASNFTDQLDIEFSTEVLENVVQIREGQNKVLGGVLGTMSDLMNADAKLISESQIAMNTSTRLLKLLERISDQVEVNSSLTREQENVAFGINVFSKQIIDDGLTIHGFENTTTGLTQLSFDSAVSQSQPIMAYVFLSPATLQKINKKEVLKNQRITSFLFNKPVFFQTNDENKTRLNVNELVYGKILSLMVNGRRVQDLEENEEIQNYFKPSSSADQKRTRCVYWNFRAKGGKGDWSSKGCKLKGLKKDMLQCSCNHMTNFAILLDVSSKPISKVEYEALSIVSYIGCIISLVALLITSITFGSFRKLRTSVPNKILLCLSCSLMMTMIIFLGGSLVKSNVACKAVATLLHYFVLSSFCWMVVEAFNIYRSFILVFRKGSSRFLLKASIFSWGTPLIIVSATTIISQLKGYDRSSVSENWRCMVAGLPFYIAYLTPISLILCANFVVLIVTMLSLGKQPSYGPDRKMSWELKTKITIMFSVLLGCTWIFGFFAIEDLKFSFQLLFCIFNSLQGFFIFLFFCVRNEDARKEWARIFFVCRVAGKGAKVPRKSSNSKESKEQTMQMEYATSWKSVSEKSLCENISND